MHAFLSPNWDIPNLVDVIFHQMFVEGVGEPTDKGHSGYILVIVVYQSHLTLEVGNIVLQALPNFHLDCEEVIVVPLEFPPRSKMVVECVGYFM